MIGLRTRDKLARQVKQMTPDEEVELAKMQAKASRYFRNDESVRPKKNTRKGLED